LKYLCVCNGAHVRSVTLARLLNKRGFEVLTCGVDSDFSDDTIKMLFNWADKVYVLGGDSLAKLMKRNVLTNETSGKIDHTTFNVGLDDWKVPQHPELLKLLRDRCIQVFGQ